MSVSYRTGRHAQLVVSGCLDAATADQIGAAFDALLLEKPTRVLLDLRQLTRFSEPGIRAMSDCLARGRRLEDGVGIRVATEAGRAVLLRSMEQV